MNLKSLEYKKRDGIVITLNVLEYNLKQKPDPNTFIFQPKNIKELKLLICGSAGFKISFRIGNPDMIDS